LNGYFYCRTPWEFELSKIIKFYKVKWPRHLYDIGGDYWSIYFRKKNNFRIVLNETSNTEISKKNILNYVVAQFLKLVSRIEKIFYSEQDFKPRWPFVGGWDIMVKKYK